MTTSNMNQDQATRAARQVLGPEVRAVRGRRGMKEIQGGAGLCVWTLGEGRSFTDAYRSAIRPGKVAEHLRSLAQHAAEQPKCYACDAKPAGLRNRRAEGGVIESACVRHADPKLCRLCARERLTDERAAELAAFESADRGFDAGEHSDAAHAAHRDASYCDCLLCECCNDALACAQYGAPGATEPSAVCGPCLVKSESADARSAACAAAEYTDASNLLRSLAHAATHVQVRATLEQIAGELAGNAERWRREPAGKVLRSA